MYRLIVFVAVVGILLSAVGCQTLPAGWATANGGRVEIVTSAVAQLVAASPEMSEAAKVRTMILSCAAVAASNYASSADGALTKQQRLKMAVLAAERFADTAYADVLAGRTLGAVVAAAVKPYLGLKAAGVPDPSEAEACIGLTLYGLKPPQ